MPDGDRKPTPTAHTCSRYTQVEDVTSPWCGVRSVRRFAAVWMIGTFRRCLEQKNQQHLWKRFVKPLETIPNRLVMGYVSKGVRICATPSRMCHYGY